MPSHFAGYAFVAANWERFDGSVRTKTWSFKNVQVLNAHAGIMKRRAAYRLAQSD